MPGLCQAIDLEATVRPEHRPGAFSAGARVFGVDLKAADFPEVQCGLVCSGRITYGLISAYFRIFCNDIPAAIST
jgi:hypothetical protein